MKSSLLITVFIIAVILALSGCTQNPSPNSNTTEFTEIGKEYDNAYSPVEVNGKLAYVAVYNGTIYSDKSVIVYDGKEIGKEYDGVSLPRQVNGKLAYRAWIGNAGDANYEFFDIYDGKEVPGIPTEVNGKIAYANGYSIVYDGQEIRGNNFSTLSNPIGVNGKLAYVEEDQPYKKFIVYDGQEIGTEYYQAYNPVEVNKKLAYVAIGNEDHYKTFIVYDGQELGKEYGEADSPVEVNKKLAYAAVLGGISFIVYDGKEIGKEYGSAGNPMEIDGKIAYTVHPLPNPYKFFIVYGGHEIGREYDSVSNMASIGGKLAFEAVKNGKHFIVMEK